MHFSYFLLPCFLLLFLIFLVFPSSSLLPTILPSLSCFSLDSCLALSPYFYLLSFSLFLLSFFPPSSLSIPLFLALSYAFLFPYISISIPFARYLLYHFFPSTALVSPVPYSLSLLSTLYYCSRCTLCCWFLILLPSFLICFIYLLLPSLFSLLLLIIFLFPLSSSRLLSSPSFSPSDHCCFTFHFRLTLVYLVSFFFSFHILAYSLFPCYFVIFL